MVEFYAQHRSSKKMMNTTDAYYKLTEKGQDYHWTNFHIVKVDMKGTVTALKVLPPFLIILCLDHLWISWKLTESIVILWSVYSHHGYTNKRHEKIEWLFSTLIM